MSQPLYTILTYDTDLGDYTPQEGLSVPSENVTILGVRRVLRELRNHGCDCHRVRVPDGTSGENWRHFSDSAVLVERTN